MNTDNFLESIFDQIKVDSDIDHTKVRISNFIPPDQMPPFIEVKTTAYRQAVGHKTAAVHINIKIVSAYCGDRELHQLQAKLIKQLTHQPFRSKDQRQIIQGRLMQSERKFENNGRIQVENMTIVFFMASLH